MKKYLTAFWITFPDDNFPFKAFGVTAFTIEDAYLLLEEFGYNCHQKAKRIEIRENITHAELDANHVHPNMGPIVVRGIWYPHHNTR